MYNSLCKFRALFSLCGQLVKLFVFDGCTEIGVVFRDGV